MFECRGPNLDLFNGIAALGPPLGQDAIGQARELAKQAQACRTPEAELTALASDPVCPACRVRLDASPPVEGVQRCRQALESALEQQRQRLVTSVVHRVMGQQQEPPLRRFLEMAQAANLAGLTEAMSEGIATFITALLTQHHVQVPASQLWASLAKEFPELAPEDTVTFATRLKGLLDGIAAEAQQAHPGQQVRLRLA